MHNGVCTVKLVHVPGPPDSQASSLQTTPRAPLFYTAWGPVPIRPHQRNGLGWPCGYRWRSPIQLLTRGLMQLNFVDQLRPTPYHYAPAHHFPSRSWYSIYRPCWDGRMSDPQECRGWELNPGRWRQRRECYHPANCRGLNISNTTTDNHF